MELNKLSNEDQVRPVSYLYVNPKEEEDFKKKRKSLISNMNKRKIKFLKICIKQIKA